MLFSGSYQSRLQLVGGLVYLFGASTSPAHGLGRLGSDLDTLLAAAVGAEPLGLLVLDSFVGDLRVVTLLVPASVAAIAEDDHVVLGTVTAAASLAECCFLCLSGWCTSLSLWLVVGWGELLGLDDLSTGLSHLWQNWDISRTV